MLVEIGLMQKFSVLLGHPIYSLAITLMSMILASGLGSMAADRVAKRSAGWLPHLPVVAGLLILVAAASAQLAIETAMAAAAPARALLAVAFTFPIGFVLGFFFPLGLGRLERAGSSSRDRGCGA